MTDSEKLDLIVLKLEKLDKLDERLDSVENNIESIQKRLDSVESNIESIQKRLDSVESNIEIMQKRLDSVESNIEIMQKKIDNMECDIKNIKITVEDEIRQNIKRVAEGHLDLSRNLHRAVKSNNEVEMLAVKVTVLESEVRKLKEKIS